MTNNLECLTEFMLVNGLYNSSYAQLKCSNGTICKINEQFQIFSGTLCFLFISFIAWDLRDVSKWSHDSSSTGYKLMVYNNKSSQAHSQKTENRTIFFMHLFQNMYRPKGYSKFGLTLTEVIIMRCINNHINTSTKVTCHNFDDLVRQCYWVWGDMTSITV